jgi:hypothetical protein
LAAEWMQTSAQQRQPADSSAASPCGAALEFPRRWVTVRPRPRWIAKFHQLPIFARLGCFGRCHLVSSAWQKRVDAKSARQRWLVLQIFAADASSRMASSDVLTVVGQAFIACNNSGSDLQASPHAA